MKHVFLVLKFTVVFFLSIGAHGFASEQKLPLIDGKKTVATVNNEPITLEEFNRVIASSHEARSGKKKAGRIDYSTILRRLINTRLILLEARNIGLDDLPEIKKAVDQYSQVSLMKLLLEEHVKNVKADEKVVDSIYRQAVKEWKIKSVLFEKEKDAKKFEEEIKNGRKFKELVKEALEAGRAKGDEAGVKR